LTPTFARKKRGNTNLNKESNQVQSSEARVQQNKGRQKQYNKQKTKSGQAFAWPIYIQEYRDEECGVFYLLYY
jgi:hypothetical protein